MQVRVQTEDFDPGAVIRDLGNGRQDMGAIVTFLGLVRDMGGTDAIDAMTLEHYPGMTEQSLEAIVAEAEGRWALQEITVIHRVGRLEPADRIVMVAVASAHRGDAFAACEFIMDYLKTRAPFWKKEESPHGARWVEARDSDDTAAARWEDRG